MNIKTNLGKPVPELILTFNWNGTVEKETKNFEGKSCTEVTKFIEEALGATDENRRFKPEYLRQERPEMNRRLNA